MTHSHVTYERPRGGSKKHALSLSKGSSRPALSHAEGKAAVMFARRAYFQYVSTETWRPACALARRSASTRRREAAFSLRSYFGEGSPAKAGNAAGDLFQHSFLSISTWTLVPWQVMSNTGESVLNALSFSKLLASVMTSSSRFRGRCSPLFFAYTKNPSVPNTGR